MTSPHSGRFPLNTDLSSLLEALRANGVTHRITEMDGEQVLLLAENTDQQLVASLLADFSAGRLPQPSTPELNFNAKLNARETIGGIGHLAKSPITSLLILLGIFGAVAIEFRWYLIVEWLMFSSAPINDHLDSLLRTYALPWESHQWWRVFTPVFLHFSWLHILFNSGAVLQVGSSLERHWGAGRYLFICVIIGIGSNIIQYIETPSPNFGGLSGIVFGLFTFNGVMQVKAPHLALRLPRGMYVMLAIWLLAGFTPIFQWFFGVNMANGAHLGGAILGVALALFCKIPNRQVGR